MGWITSRWGAPLAIAAVSLLVVLHVLVAGWPLPRLEHCAGGLCETSSQVDWQRIDWAISPRDVACGVHNPGPGDVLMAPGDVCVRGEGDPGAGAQTYAEVRRRRALRRVTTLSVMALLIAATPMLMTRAARRRPVEV